MSTTKRAYVPVEQRREQLVAAALRVLQRDGAAALTTRAVADEAGVALGAVHYAFGSKGDLVRAVFRADHERATRTLTEGLHLGGDAETMLVRAARAYARDIIEDPDTELALHELGVLGARDDEYRAAALESVEDYRASAQDLLREVAERTGGSWSADTVVLAESLTTQLFGLSLSWLTTRDDALFLACVEEEARGLAVRLSI